MPPILAQQGLIIVDGSGETPGAFRSITEAVSSSNVGETIFIRGLEASGVPFAYAKIVEPAFWPTQDPEVFPIHLKPGMTLKPLDSTPVYVWSNTRGAVPPSLFEIDPGNTGAPTKMVSLHLAGASAGIKVAGTAGSYHDVVLKDVKLSWHTTGPDVLADDGSYIDIVLQDYRIVDHKRGSVGFDPVLQDPSIGLRFHATEGTNGPGGIHAVLNNFETARSFLTGELAPTGFKVTPNNLSGNFTQVTRLIEVYAEGVTGEHPDQVNDPSGVRTISEVDLDINGGIFDGKASGNSGWDIGIYAALEHNPANLPNDFRSGYDITIAGSEIKDFRIAGIYGCSGQSARGAFHLSGQTSVTGAGKQGAAVANQIYPSGALLFSQEGYLGFHAADSEFNNNRGNGITLDTSVTMDDIIYPVGLFLELLDCGIHNNGGNGLAMQASTSSNALITVGNAIVGGTWDFWPNPPGNKSLADKTDEPTDLGHGQGIVNRCAISNNGLVTGGAGIRVYTKSEDDDGSSPREVIANTRFVNTFVWNNGGGAFLGQLLGNQAYMLTPVVQSTFVGNATASPGYTMEVVELLRYNGQASVGIYEWQETPSYYLRNRLFDSIFQMDPSQGGDDDFGPGLTNLIVEDDDPSGFLGINQIG